MPPVHGLPTEYTRMPKPALPAVEAALWDLYGAAGLACPTLCQPGNTDNRDMYKKYAGPSYGHS